MVKSHESPEVDRTGSSVEVTHEETVEDHLSPTDEGPIRKLLKNPVLVAVSLYANLGSFMYGFDNTALATALSFTPFQMQFGVAQHSVDGTTFIIPAYWQSLWNSLAQIATSIGSFSVAAISDRFGRRTAFTVSGLISIAGVSVLYTSSTPAVFLVGKMINGIAMGMGIACGQTYISEVSPVKCRGILLSIYVLSLYFGSFIASLICNSRVNITDQSGYKVLFALGFVWAGILAGCSWFIPESPILHIRNGSLDKAQTSFTKLYKKGTDISSILDDAVATDGHEKELSGDSEGTTYMDCFRHGNWRRTKIVLYLNGLNQLIGSTFAGNGPYFLVNAGMSASQTTLVSLIGGGLNCVSMIVIFYLLARFNRRKIILTGILICATLFLPMGIAGCFPGNSAAMWTIGVLLQCVTVLGFAPCVGPAAAVAAEIPAARQKSKSQSIGYLWNYIFSTIWNVFVPYLFNEDEANLGGKMGFIFFGTSILAYVVLFLQMPETKDITNGEMDCLFERNTPARSFKSALMEMKNSPMLEEKVPV